MFCILYELGEQTGTAIVDHEQPSSDCKYCGGSSCESIVNTENRKMSHHELDWIIDVQIKLAIPFTNKKQTIEYGHALRLMHPFKEDIWIMRGTKVENETATYSAFHSNAVYNSTNLHDIMESLRVKCSYDAHSVEESDFGIT